MVVVSGQARPSSCGRRTATLWPSRASRPSPPGLSRSAVGGSSQAVSRGPQPWGRLLQSINELTAGWCWWWVWSSSSLCCPNKGPPVGGAVPVAPAAAHAPRRQPPAGQPKLLPSSLSGREKGAEVSCLSDWPGLMAACWLVWLVACWCRRCVPRAWPLAGPWSSTSARSPSDRCSSSTSRASPSRNNGRSRSRRMVEGRSCNMEWKR